MKREITHAITDKRLLELLKYESACKNDSSSVLKVEIQGSDYYYDLNKKIEDIPHLKDFLDKERKISNKSVCAEIKEKIEELELAKRMLVEKSREIEYLQKENMKLNLDNKQLRNKLIVETSEKTKKIWGIF